MSLFRESSLKFCSLFAVENDTSVLTDIIGGFLSGVLINIDQNLSLGFVALRS